MILVVSGVIQGLGRGPDEEVLADLGSSMVEWQEGAQLLYQVKARIGQLHTIEGLPGDGGNEFYKRTANIPPVLDVRGREFWDAARGEPVAAAGAELKDQVKKTWAAPNLLTSPGKWPTGTDLAGRAPGQTNQVEAPDGPVEATPQCHPKPADQDGTKRW